MIHRKLYVVILTLIIICVKSQVKVLDNNKNPIPYAKAKLGDNTIAYSDTKGKIKIKEAKIDMITTKGYDTLFVSQKQDVYYLNKSKAVENVLPTNIPKRTKTFIENSLQERGNDYYQQSLLADNKENIYAFLLPYKSDYPEIVFLKELSLIIGSKPLRKVTFFLNFYKNNNGLPGEFYATKQIPIGVKNNVFYNKVKIDLSKKNILIPKEGLFIGFEWIINDENIVIPNKIFDTKNYSPSYYPQIKTIKTNENSLFSYDGKNWKEVKDPFDNPITFDVEAIVTD